MSTGKIYWVQKIIESTTFGVAQHEENFEIFTYLMETVFPAFRVTQNFSINMNISFSWKMAI